ncbi:MAG: hypothetical protein NVS2B3_07690 [Vulcanimicrobiaceae bacterium]
MPHSQAFVALRTALLALDEAERRRIADLAGAMTEPKPPISRELASVLALLAALDANDRRRFATWCARYLSRWGQVPVAASRSLESPVPGASARALPKR